MTRIFVGDPDQSTVTVDSVSALRGLFLAGPHHLVSFEWDGEWQPDTVAQVIGVLSEMVGAFGGTLDQIKWCCKSESQQGIIKEFLS